MKKTVLIVAAAVAALAILWIGIGIGAASAVPAECSSAAGRVECWEGGDLHRPGTHHQLGRLHRSKNGGMKKC